MNTSCLELTFFVLYHLSTSLWWEQQKGQGFVWLIQGLGNPASSLDLTSPAWARREWLEEVSSSDLKNSLHWKLNLCTCWDLHPKEQDQKSGIWITCLASSSLSTILTTKHKVTSLLLIVGAPASLIMKSKGLSWLPWCQRIPLTPCLSLISNLFTSVEFRFNLLIPLPRLLLSLRATQLVSLLDSHFTQISPF